MHKLSAICSGNGLTVSNKAGVQDVQDAVPAMYRSEKHQQLCPCMHVCAQVSKVLTVADFEAGWVQLDVSATATSLGSVQELSKAATTNVSLASHPAMSAALAVEPGSLLAVMSSGKAW